MIRALHPPRGIPAALLLALGLCCLAGAAEARRPFRLGLNADNWKGQVLLPAFRDSIRAMGVEFIVWHIMPVELADGSVQDAIDFCREEGLDYLFNTEIVNYAPRSYEFTTDGGLTYRWDIKNEFLESLRDDPRFLGVVYDESLLMQSLAGAVIAGRPVMPYYDETSMATPEGAFRTVADKIDALSRRYASFGKSMVLETLFPDYSFAASRGGAIQAVKLLKENYNDLMAMTARGAANQYLEQNEKNGRGTELWACVDLWWLDSFPNASSHGDITTGAAPGGVDPESIHGDLTAGTPRVGTEVTGDGGGHSPEELYDALRYAHDFGFDAAYIEMAKGLMDPTGRLSRHGEKVAEFNRWRREQTTPRADWRAPPVAAFTVRRFPSGNPGGRLPPFLELTSYGSRQYFFLRHNNSSRLSPGGNKYFAMDMKWWSWLAGHSELLRGVPPEKFPGTTFNSIPFGSSDHIFALGTEGRRYQPYLGLPEINFVDHTHPPLTGDKEVNVDFYGNGKR